MVKLHMYARAGIAQYVVVDLVHDVVLDRRKPSGDDYHEVASLRAGDGVELRAGERTVLVPVAISCPDIRSRPLARKAAFERADQVASAALRCLLWHDVWAKEVGMLHCTLILVMMSIYLAGPQQAAASGEAPIVAYEVYSWQDARANWVFALLPHTSREKTVREVFGPKFRIVGVDGVKKSISRLREKTTVFMVSRLPSGTKPKAKGSEHLKLPPADIIEAMRDHAKKHNITVEIPDAASP